MLSEIGSAESNDIYARAVLRNAEISGITQKSRALILRVPVLVVCHTDYMIIKLPIKSVNNGFESCLLIVRKKILDIFQKTTLGRVILIIFAISKKLCLFPGE